MQDSHARPVDDSPPASHEAGSGPVLGTLLLDDVREWPRFGRCLDDIAGRWESHIVIGGMYCAACALTIEDALRTVPGVEQVEVSTSAERARVVWLAGQTRPLRWMAAIEAAGYRVQPAMDASVRELRRQESRQLLWRWLVAAFCMMQVMMYAWPVYVAQPGDLSADMESLLRWASWVISLPVLLFTCQPFFKGAWRDLRRRQVGMDLPVALGMGIAFGVSTLGTLDPGGPFGSEVYFDSFTMFVFFLLSGRLLEQRLRHRNAGLLDAALNRLPQSVQRVENNGGLQPVALSDLRVGDTIHVLPGDIFAADGVVRRGYSQADESLLTGEATPRPKTIGDSVVSGSANLVAPLDIEVVRLGEQTVYAGMVALMRQAATQKPAMVQLADRVARPFLWGVLLCAVLAAVLWWPQGPAQALMVAVAVLIVTCPCALSLAAPASLLCAAGAAARHGALVRRLQALEQLNHVDTVVFDKTGTLTDGRLSLQQVTILGPLPGKEVSRLAALLARQSHHPAARALVQPDTGEASGWRMDEVHEVAGHGLQARVVQLGNFPNHAAMPPTGQSFELRLGSAAFTELPQDEAPGARLVLAWRGCHQGPWQPLAAFSLTESPRPEAFQALQALRQAGLHICLLSGDREEAVQALAHQLDIEVAHGQCSPAGKLDWLQARQSKGHRIAMVGDGLNDGPVLAAAQVSFAMGDALPLAQAQSDIVIPGGDLRVVACCMLHARATLRVIRQNLLWAAAYNVLCVPLAMLGHMPAWLAGLGMALSSLAVVLNAARLLRWPATGVPRAGAVSGTAATPKTQAMGRT